MGVPKRRKNIFRIQDPQPARSAPFGMFFSCPQIVTGRAVPLPLAATRFGPSPELRADGSPPQVRGSPAHDVR
jgi:hypothetical protein